INIYLTANITAGHLLLTLLRSSGSSFNNLIIIILILFSQIILFTLEISMRFIQAYFKIMFLLF
ncbi:hypothetical protein EAG_01158, partial [Camponotus floridanus]